jgi:DNA-binding response OmpR family regulator
MRREHFRLFRRSPARAGRAKMCNVSEEASGAVIRVVYVEDDERLARLTTHYLNSHGIEVHRVSRGDQALGEVLRVRPDVVLLDLMLPGMSGQEVCRAVRQRLDVPIVMITALNEEADRVMGLEGGADDYVTKPFSSRELLARVRAQARRGRGESGPRATRLELGELTLDSATVTVSVRGVALTLTTFEFSLLRVLMERAGRVLSREQLLELVHGSSDEAFDRSIDVHVSRLRQKLELDPRKPRLLKTIRGIGYMLTPDAP